MNLHAGLPLVTIVTVAYNCEALIESTLKSVCSQTYPNKEYIIVDGESEDGTIALIKKYGVCIAQFISEADRGIYDAMNKGIKLASPESRYINFLNAGDIYADDQVIARMVPAMRHRSSNLYGDCSLNQKVIEAPNRLNRFVLATNMISHQACFFRTDIHRRFPYDIRFKICADYKLLLDLIQAGESFEKINLTVVEMDPGGVSRTNRPLLHVEKDRIRRQYPEVYLYAWIKNTIKRFRKSGVVA